MTDTLLNRMNHWILDPKPAQLWSKALAYFMDAHYNLRSSIDSSPNVGERAFHNKKAAELLRELGTANQLVSKHARYPRFSDSLESRDEIYELLRRGIDAMRYVVKKLLLPDEAADFDPRFAELETAFETAVVAYAAVTPTHVLLQAHQELVAREAGCFWPGHGASWPKMEHEFARRMEPLLQARDIVFDELSATKLEAYLEIVDRFFANLLAVAPTESEAFAALPLHEERMKLAAQLEAAVLLHELGAEESPVRDTVTTSQTSGGASHG